MSLQEYVTSNMCLELNNGQVRTLSGPGHVDVPYGMCPPDMLDTACHNLDRHFSVIGISERFDETLLLMKERLGWVGLPVYARKNVTKQRPSRADVSESLIRRIEADNELDIELYRRYRDAFEREFDVMLQTDPESLNRFRAWNRVYVRCLRPFNVARRAVVTLKGRNYQNGFERVPAQ